MFFSVLGPTFTKKLFSASTISLGFDIILLLTFIWVIVVSFDDFMFIIDLIPSQVFLILLLLVSKYLV